MNDLNHNEFWGTKLVRIIGWPAILSLLGVWIIAIVATPFLLVLAIPVAIYEQATGKPAPWKRKWAIAKNRGDP